MKLYLHLKNFFFDSVNVPYNFFSSNENINYVDIGASNIQNIIFYSKFKFLNLILFEPDYRVLKSYFVDNANKINLKIFDKGLWKNKSKKYFYLLKNQISSSFFKPNFPVLSYYNLGTDMYSLKKKILFEVNSLDSFLNNYNVDFLKIDTEGSDFEILLGAKKNLNSCLGIIVECQFIERYKKSKNFSEIELFLRNKGFELFVINSEKWQQHSYHNINTNIKEVWSDVLYFKSLKTFLQKLSKIKKKNKKLFLVKKYIFLMIVYKLHDTSLKYLEIIKKNNHISEKEFSMIEKFIKKNIKSNFLIIFQDFFRFLICLILFPIIFIMFKKYLSLFKYLIKKNLRNLSRLISSKILKTSIFRQSGIDLS